MRSRSMPRSVGERAGKRIAHHRIRFLLGRTASAVVMLCCGSRSTKCDSASCKRSRACRRVSPSRTSLDPTPVGERMRWTVLEACTTRTRRPPPLESFGALAYRTPVTDAADIVRHWLRALVWSHSSLTATGALSPFCRLLLSPHWNGNVLVEGRRNRDLEAPAASGCKVCH
jgi:hypothetical protein